MKIYSSNSSTIAVLLPDTRRKHSIFTLLSPCLYPSLVTLMVLKQTLGRHSVEECEKGVDTTSDRGRTSMGTTDDGEYLNRITGGKERNSRGCQTVLTRRDAPASIKGLCPSMKNPWLCRGLLLCTKQLHPPRRRMKSRYDEKIPSSSELQQCIHGFWYSHQWETAASGRSSVGRGDHA